MQVTINNSLVHFKGQYEEPVEEKAFTSTVFSAREAEHNSHIKIELTMEYELLEWKIKIVVYDPGQRG